MKVINYVDQIMSKFEFCNGYSELPYDKLKLVITKYLFEEHDEKIQELFHQSEEDKNNYGYFDVEKYREEYAAIKGRVTEKARELAQTEKI